MIRVLLSVFFLEVGLVLTVVPWSTYWERNYFAGVIPLLNAFITNHFVRGAVSGLGLVNVAAAVSEVTAMFAARRLSSRVMSIQQSPIVEE